MWLNCFITLHVLIPGIRRVKCNHLYFCLLHGRFPAWGCHGFHPLHHLIVPLAWDNLQPVIKNNSIKPLPVADPGEGSRGLIFRPNWGPKGRKKVFTATAPPPLPNGLDDRPPYFKVWIRQLLLSFSERGQVQVQNRSCEFYLQLSGALERSTVINSCNGVFTSEFIFR